MYVTPCCTATVTITIDDGALSCRACYTAVDPRLAWDPGIDDTSRPHRLSTVDLKAVWTLTVGGQAQQAQTPPHRDTHAHLAQRRIGVPVAAQPLPVDPAAGPGAT
jgi:hypothetical protein